MNWQIGDKAIIYQAAPYLERFVGEIVCIASVPYYDFSWMTTYVKIEPISGYISVDIRCLKPIDDGFEAGSMDAIEKIAGWKPKELVRVTGKTATVAALGKVI